MRVLREFESHRFRQDTFSHSLKQSLNPALRIALAGFLLLKQSQIDSEKRSLLLLHLLLQGNLLAEYNNKRAQTWQ